MPFWHSQLWDSEMTSFFSAYQQQFNLLTTKGYKIQLNVMDNQAIKMIKTIWTKNNVTYY
jgi:hypothetical protein